MPSRLAFRTFRTGLPRGRRPKRASRGSIGIPGLQLIRPRTALKTYAYAALAAVTIFALVVLLFVLLAAGFICRLMWLAR